MNRQGNLFCGMPKTVNQNARAQQAARIEGPKPRPLHNLNRHGNSFMGIQTNVKSTNPGMVLNQYRPDPRAVSAQDRVDPAPVRQHAMNRHGNLFAGLPVSATVYEAAVYRPGIAAKFEKNQFTMTEQDCEAIIDDSSILHHTELFNDHIDSRNESLDKDIETLGPSESEGESEGENDNKSYAMDYATYHLTSTDGISWDDTYANGLEPDDALWDELRTASPPLQNAQIVEIDSEALYQMIDDAFGFIDEDEMWAVNGFNSDFDVIEINGSPLNGSVDDIVEHFHSKDKLSINSDNDSGIHSDDEKSNFKSIVTSKTPRDNNTPRSWELPPLIAPLDLMAFVNKKMD